MQHLLEQQQKVSVLISLIKWYRIPQNVDLFLMGLIAFRTLLMTDF